MLSPPLSPYPGIDVVAATASAARKSHPPPSLPAGDAAPSNGSNGAPNELQAKLLLEQRSYHRIEQLRGRESAKIGSGTAIPAPAGSSSGGHRRQLSALNTATQVPDVPTRQLSVDEDSTSVQSPNTSVSQESGEYATDDDEVDVRHHHHHDIESSARDSAVFLNPATGTQTSRKRGLESPPSPRERCMTTCWDSLVSNPAKYLRRERSFLELYPMRRHSWASPGVYDGSIDGSVGSVGGRGTIRRRRGQPSSASTASVTTAAARARRFGSYGPDDGVPGFRRRAASAVADRNSSDCSDTELDGRAKSSSPGAEGSKKRSSSSTASSSGGSAPSRVHDMSLNQLEDFSPPITTLPPGRSLRAEWKGAPMDLSNDPDVHLLHPAEVHLASVLRLPAEVYLDSKRRLFAEKVHRLRQRLPFRRTDSQKACRIDVNKASRLFGAFERVGWLENELFEKYLN